MANPKTLRSALKDAMKAGYRVETLKPTAIAALCAAQFGRRIQVLPRLVRN